MKHHFQLERTMIEEKTFQKKKQNLLSQTFKKSRRISKARTPDMFISVSIQLHTNVYYVLLFLFIILYIICIIYIIQMDATRKYTKQL